MINKTVLDEIREIVGKDQYSDIIEDRTCYSYDGTPLFSKLPDAIVKPISIESISKLVKLANKEKFAIIPRGSGTGLSGGSIPVENSIVLRMNHFNKILELDEKNLTITVEPGVITGTIHQCVEQRELFYPPDPGSAAICTIGGNIAENAGGIRGLKYGVTRDYVLSLEAILPNGDLLQTGTKCVKDVAGFSLRDILIGSEGAFGIITKATLKLLPLSKASKTIVAHFNSISDAARTVSDIIAAKILPCTLEFLDNVTIKCVEDYAKLGLDTSIEALLLIEVDGHKIVVEEDSKIIFEICKKNNSSNIVIAKDADESIKLKSARKIAFASLARKSHTTILEDATFPRSEIERAIVMIQNIAKKYNVEIGIFGHAGDGNLHPTILADERDKEMINRAEKAIEEIFNETVKMGGTITGEHGIGLAKRKYLLNLVGDVGLEMMKKLKLAFDPNLIMNPGKVIEF